MKKIYTLAIALFGVIAFAQTPMNTNGDLQNWPDGTISPEGWFINEDALGDGIVAKITEDDNIFVKITPPTSGNNNAGLADMPVVAGQEYTVTFSYKTAGAAKFRFWGQWRTDSAAIQGLTGNDFLPSGYNETAAGEWAEVTITATAPENATFIRPSFRNFNGGTDLFIDNVVFYQENASVKSNDIAGLNIYPNPATGNTLYVTSFNSVDKTVTIFDVLGKQVINTTTVNGAVNIANLNAGVYIVKVTEEGKTATRKLVVK